MVQGGGAQVGHACQFVDAQRLVVVPVQPLDGTVDPVRLAVRRGDVAQQLALRGEAITLKSDGTSRGQNALSPSLAGKWDLAQGWLLRSSIGTGIKAPKLADQIVLDQLVYRMIR